MTNSYSLYLSDKYYQIVFKYTHPYRDSNIRSCSTHVEELLRANFFLVMLTKVQGALRKLCIQYTTKWELEKTDSKEINKVRTTGIKCYYEGNDKNRVDGGTKTDKLRKRSLKRDKE
jgi:hypothetical protein